MARFDVVPCQPPRKWPCPIAFVGEAPGEEETWKGKPFVGPSGRVFDAILRSANLDRADYLITNVFDRKAEDNEVGPWLQDRGLTQAAYDRLAGELTRYQPSVIVPLGGTALQAFTGFTKIADFRGSVMAATRIVPGAKLLPTFHPMAVQHSWKLQPLVLGDFIKADVEAKVGPKITYPEVTLYIEPNIKDVEAYCKRCLKSKLLAVDIETGWGQITTIGFAPEPDEAMNIPFLDLRKPNKSYWATPDLETRAWLLIAELLESDVPKVLQNGTYDAAWLWVKKHIAIRNYRHEIRLLHHALYPELPKSLGSMAANYTRLGAWKHWGHGGSEDKKDN